MPPQASTKSPCIARPGLSAEARAGKTRADAERAVLAKIAQMPQPDRTLGERLHAIVRAHAPALWPKLWYGMPAYANPQPPGGDGKVVCFFQAATKFKTRYASFAFMDTARLDERAGGMWPTGFGLKELTAAEEATIVALVKKAMTGVEVSPARGSSPPNGATGCSHG
jgi:hypothetical protein